MDAKEQELIRTISALRDADDYIVTKDIIKLIKQARNDALEEAAELAVKLTINGTFTPHEIGLAIRVLKEKI